MLRKTIACLVIASMLLIDVARAMEEKPAATGYTQLKSSLPRSTPLPQPPSPSQNYDIDLENDPPLASSEALRSGLHEGEKESVFPAQGYRDLLTQQQRDYLLSIRYRPESQNSEDKDHSLLSTAPTQSPENPPSDDADTGSESLSTSEGDTLSTENNSPDLSPHNSLSTFPEKGSSPTSFQLGADSSKENSEAQARPGGDQHPTGENEEKAEGPKEFKLIMDQDPAPKEADSLSSEASDTEEEIIYEGASAILFQRVNLKSSADGLPEFPVDEKSLFRAVLPANSSDSSPRNREGADSVGTSSESGSPHSTAAATDSSTESEDSPKQKRKKKGKRKGEEIAFQLESEDTQEASEDRHQKIRKFLGLIPADVLEEDGNLLLPYGAINGDDERRPLLFPAVSRGRDVDLESNRPEKAKLMKQWLNGLLTQDLEKTLDHLLSWMTSLAEDPDVQNVRLVDWILDLAKDHQHFLGDAYIKELESFIEQNPNLEHITVGEWARETSHQAPSEDEKYEELNPGSQDHHAFFELIEQVIVCEMGYQFAMGEFDGMDPKLKAFLAYFQKYKVEEKFTRAQWGLGVLAILTAIGSSIAQGTIFTAGLKEFVFDIGLKEYFNGSTITTQSVGAFTIATSLLDSLPRDWQEFTELAGASKRQFRSNESQMGWVMNTCKSGTIYLLAVPATWLAVYYFFSIENDGIKWLKNQPDYPNRDELIKEGWAYFGLLVPWLAGDALMGTVHQMREVKELAGRKWHKLTGWLEGGVLAELPLINTLIKHRPLAEPEIQRHEFLKTLKDIRRVIFLMDSEDVEEAYSQVYKPIFKRKKEKGTDQLNAAEAFSTLSYFMQYLEKEAGEEEGAQQGCISKTWKDRLSEGLGLFFATTASYARYLTYQFVMRALFSAMGIESEIALDVLSNMGAIVGFFVQGLTEEMSMEENVNGLLNKKVHSRTSHPWARGVTNAISGILGIYYTLPYLVTGWLAMEDYPVPAQVLCLTPYLIADSHSNGWFFKDTYGSYVDMYDRVKMKFCGNCCGGISPDSKRDKMIKWIDELSDFAREADPEVISTLNQMLERFNQTTFQREKMPSREASKESGSPPTPRRSSKNSLHEPPQESLSELLRNETLGLVEERGSLNTDANDFDGEGSLRELKEWILLKSTAGALEK